MITLFFDIKQKKNILCWIWNWWRYLSVAVYV